MVTLMILVAVFYLFGAMLMFAFMVESGSIDNETHTWPLVMLAWPMMVAASLTSAIYDKVKELIKK